MPWRLPPLHPLPSRGSRGTGKPRTLCAARTRKRGCLKLWIKNLKRGASQTSPRSFAGRGRRASSDARRVRGQALSCWIKKLSGRKVCNSTSTTRESSSYLPQCLAPHPKPSLRYGFDLSPQERGEVRKRAASGVRASNYGRAVAPCACLSIASMIGGHIGIGMAWPMPSIINSFAPGIEAAVSLPPSGRTNGSTVP